MVDLVNKEDTFNYISNNVMKKKKKVHFKSVNSPLNHCCLTLDSLVGRCPLLESSNCPYRTFSLLNHCCPVLVSLVGWCPVFISGDSPPCLKFSLVPESDII